MAVHRHDGPDPNGVIAAASAAEKCRKPVGPCGDAVAAARRRTVARLYVRPPDGRPDDDPQRPDSVAPLTPL